MAKVKTPLLGFGAEGTIGNALTFSKWKGIAYAREHVIPANPRTANQTTVRNAFAWINDCYRFAPSQITAVWRSAVSGRAETDRNAFIRYNMPAVRSTNNIQDIIISCGTGNAPALADMTAGEGPSSGEITVTATAPDLPTGWALNAVVWYAILDQDPQDAYVNDTAIATDTSAPYTANITVATPGGRYVVAAYPVYSNAKGKTVYGPSINAVANAKE